MLHSLQVSDALKASVLGECMVSIKQQCKRSVWFIFIIGLIYTAIIIVRSIIFYNGNTQPIHTNVIEAPSLYYHDPTFCRERCAQVDDSEFILDENGVYMVNMSKVKSLRTSNTNVYYPSSIGQMVLVHRIRYERFKDEIDLKRMMDNANWFADNLNKEGCWLFTNDVHYSKGKTLKAPFCSAMGQGLAFSALVSAFYFSGDDSYLKTALKGLPPFNQDNPFTVVGHLADGSPFYEELGAKQDSIHILNGYIFALLGLYDLTKATGSVEAKELYEAGLDTLRQHIGRFDSGNWSYYSLDPQSNIYNHWRYASPSYQRLHTMQLKVMAQITQEEVFEKAYQTHKQHLGSSWVNFVIIPAYLVYQDLSHMVRTLRK